MRYMNTKQNRTLSLLLGLFMILAGQVSFSQSCGEFLTVPEQLDGYCKSSFIKAINNGNISLNDLNYTGESCWYVFSDRSNNTCYKRPNGYARGTLGFMERVLVKEVRGNWLHVYSPESGSQYQERGWIKAEFVLLSIYSLLNEKSTPRKAMILISLSNMDHTVLENDDILANKFYNKPSAVPGNFNNKTAKKFVIYFILKEESGAVLLSKTDKLKSSQAELQVDVPGWIPKVNVTFWDHRVCLEPASLESSASAVQDYAGKPLPVFDTREELNAFIQSQVYSPRDVIKKYQVDTSRPDAYVMRMPILKHHDERLKEVACIAQIADSNQKTFTYDVERKIQELKTKLNNVNILFVVDGTESMRKYYPSVAKSIERIIKVNEGDIGFY